MQVRTLPLRAYWSTNHLKINLMSKLISVEETNFVRRSLSALLTALGEETLRLQAEKRAGV